MRRLKGEDNSFLAWESTTQPQHTFKAVVLDPNRGHEPLTFDTVKTRFPGVVDRVEPLQWQLLMPRVGFGRPWWVKGYRTGRGEARRRMGAICGAANWLLGSVKI